MLMPERPKSKFRFVFHVYVDAKGEYRWRLWAKNGRIVADSGEGYKQKRNCVEMCTKLTDWLYKSEIVDRT